MLKESIYYRLVFVVEMNCDTEIVYLSALLVIFVLPSLCLYQSNDAIHMMQ